MAFRTISLTQKTQACLLTLAWRGIVVINTSDISFPYLSNWLFRLSSTTCTCGSCSKERFMGLSRKGNCEVWWRFMQAHPAPHGGSTSRYGQHAEQGAKGAFERYHEARSYM